MPRVGAKLPLVPVWIDCSHLLAWSKHRPGGSQSGPGRGLPRKEPQRECGEGLGGCSQALTAGHPPGEAWAEPPRNCCWGRGGWVGVPSSCTTGTIAALPTDLSGTGGEGESGTRKSPAVQRARRRPRTPGPARPTPRRPPGAAGLAGRREEPRTHGRRPRPDRPRGAAAALGPRAQSAQVGTKRHQRRSPPTRAAAPGARTPHRGTCTSAAEARWRLGRDRRCAPARAAAMETGLCVAEEGPERAGAAAPPPAGRGEGGVEEGLGGGGGGERGGGAGGGAGRRRERREGPRGDPVACAPRPRRAHRGAGWVGQGSSAGSRQASRVPGPGTTLGAPGFTGEPRPSGGAGGGAPRARASRRA